MQPEQRDAAYLWDMLDAATSAQRLISGMGSAHYSSDRRTQLAVERCLEIVGEAARNISVGFREAYPEVPWRQIIGQRNVLIHEYGEIKQERVWKTVSEDIPMLIEFLRRFV